MAIQLPLQFQFQCNQSFDSFFAGNNGEIVQQLHNFLQNLHERQLFIWGKTGLGKTHLLQATCLAAETFNKTPFYLSLSNQLPDPVLLEGLENMDIICLDDIDAIAGNSKWEHALFNFYNRHRENNKQLLISAKCPPRLLTLSLPDLKTRMSWGLTLKLNEMNEEQLIQTLDRKAHQMGFSIPVHIGKFLLTHYDRDLSSLWGMLTKIDHATLSAKRRLTIPFLKQIISSHDER